MYIYIHICIIYYICIDHLKRGYRLIIQQLAWFQKHSAENHTTLKPNGTTKISWEISEFHPTFRFLSQTQKPNKKKTHTTPLQQGPFMPPKQTSASSCGDIYFQLRRRFFSPKEISAASRTEKKTFEKNHRTSKVRLLLEAHLWWGWKLVTWLINKRAESKKIGG